MKRTLTILALSILLISCKKETYCWQCTTTTTTVPSSAGGTGVSVTDVCDMSIKDMEKKEQDGTKNTVTVRGGMNITQVAITKCVRQ